MEQTNYLAQVTSSLQEGQGVELLFQFFREGVRDLYNIYLANIIGPYLPLIKVILVALIFLLSAGIFWAVLVLRDAQRREREKHEPIDLSQEEADRRMSRWEIVIDHMRSDHPAEWRLAIIEADRLLDDVLSMRGYEGEGLGERLKQLTIYDLRTLDDAWEAHKVRNRVAHEGNDFELTERRTREVVGQFEAVLRELGYF